MRKSKKHLDLSIEREVTTRIRITLVDMLNQYISECAGFGLQPNQYFESTYLLECLLSKYVDENTDSPELRKHRAIVKWLSVEQLNRSTNERLFSTDPTFRGIGHGHEILRKAAKLIRRILGAVPEDLLHRGSYSGGASTSLRRDVGVLAKKFSGRPDATPLAWKLLSSTVQDFEVWTMYNPGVANPRLVRGNVLFTVPKTSVIDRVACKEPDLNIFAQKAVGDYIRRRLLRKAKINLNDQSINKNLARKGSITGKLATIDLSSASDSLTTGLVSLLLPYEWFTLLDSLRSPKTFIDGRSHVNEMFSSMGNGFTFELESLIFWAIAHTIRGITRSQGEVSVYGDDIIVPTSMAGMLIQFLHWVGFRTNANKTFYKGRFRESCGGHYYGGRDVTPFYLRRPLRDVSDLILFLNQYRKWLITTEMDTVDNGWDTKNRFVRFWYNLAAFVPKCLWGGFDLDSRSQLVAPVRQQCELLATTRRWARLETENQVGLYLSRLSELDRRRFPRDTDLAPEASMVTPTGKYVVRRCKIEPHVFGLVRPTFTCEQGSDWVLGQ